MTAPFISSTDLVAYLRITEDVVSSDLAEIALDSACQEVRDYCDQPLDAATEADAYFDGDGSKLLALPAFPVSAVTSLTVYTDRSPTATSEVLVQNTDFVLDSGRGLVHRIDGGTFTRGRQNIKVTYSHGYAIVPSSVRLVALQVASRIYAIGMAENESVGGVSTTWVKGAGSLTDDEKDALNRRRVGGAG